VPAAAHRAALEAWRFGTEEGRGAAYYQRFNELSEALRARYARLLGAAPRDVAMTCGTSDGCGRVVAGLALSAGDEIVTADDEHPGLLGPLIAAREQRGVTVRAVPLAELPGAIGERTRLVACSHVSWHSGALAPVAEIVAAAAARDVPVLLDGAQGAGAIPVDVGALGVQFYAGSGQKWLCGPVGAGMVWIAPDWQPRVAALAPAYAGLTDAAAGLDTALVPDAHRYDIASRDLASVAAAVAAFDVLDEAGFAEVQAASISRAAGLAARLAEAGLDVVPRGDSTLVSWSVASEAEAVATRDRLETAGVMVRDLPGAARLRASVGAWNDDDDLQRLLAGLR
jgi:L-cysteine/cystine lyase